MPTFEEYCVDIANGISTSCDGVYIVPKSLVSELGIERDAIEPCIRGGQFNRFYCPRSTKEFVLYVDGDFDRGKYANAFMYLKKHKHELIEKCVEKHSGTREWYLLFRARDRALFGKPKILVRQTADRIVAAIDEETGYYCIDSVNVAVLRPEMVKRRRFFLGLLNSTLLNFFYREISQEGGRVLAQVKPQRIKRLPITFGEDRQEKAIEARVEKIIAAKADDPAANTSELEGEINAIVYELYDLSQTEIGLVESCFKC